MPFATAWMGENHFGVMPVAVYALDLCLRAVSYTFLQRQIIKSQGPDSLLHQAVGNDLKGKISLSAYVAAIPLALIGYPILSGLLLAAVAAIWFIPDRRIEKKLQGE